MSDVIKGPWLRQGRTVYALNDRGCNRFFASVQDAHTSEQELEEIAQLMASATELLEALIELRDAYQEFMKLPACKANAAIAKATGGQS